VIEYAAFPLLSYLVGAIPFGFLIVKFRKGIDLRTVGSGNLGATNAARILGTRWFFLIFALDFLKGFGPAFGLAWLSRGHFGAPAEIGLLYGVAAIAGHIWPVWLRFRGGKGVATATGAVMGVAPVAAAVALVVFLAVFAAFRYVSLGSVCAAVTLPAAYAALWWHSLPDATLGTLLVIAVLVIVKHRANLRRILAGTEPKAVRKKGGA
jgi:glycerol-3-phosphate acyltransferase PlsY